MLLPIDLETTGLDREQDRILEVSWTILQDDLSPHLVQSDGVTDAIYSEVVQPSSVAWHRIYEQSFIENMHSHSGLLDELEQIANDVRPALTIPEVEARILSDINAGVSDDTPLVLFGHSPQGVDRPFIDRWMPELSARLHYRHYDVRTLDDFYEKLGVYHGINTTAHRAADDIAGSIKIARFYRDYAKLGKRMIDALGTVE